MGDESCEGLKSSDIVHDIDSSPCAEVAEHESHSSFSAHCDENKKFCESSVEFNSPCQASAPALELFELSESLDESKACACNEVDEHYLTYVHQAKQMPIINFASC